MEEIKRFSENKTAGKVNFNIIASDDYLTSESYKTLRTNILFCGSDIKTIIITSSRENEGKSTISAALAGSFADMGKKTLLIDADMRKSVMINRNKASKLLGLSEYLSGQAQLSEVVYNTQNPCFDVMFCGHFPPNPVELLSSPKFEELLKTTKEMYDFVIVDSPPLNAVIDTAVMAQHCDGAVMIVTAGRINVTEAFHLKEKIEKSGCRLLGAVLNDIYAKHSRRHKSDYKKYSYYYTHDNVRETKEQKR